METKYNGRQGYKNASTHQATDSVLQRKLRGDSPNPNPQSPNMLVIVEQTLNG